MGTKHGRTPPFQIETSRGLRQCSLRPLALAPRSCASLLVPETRPEPPSFAPLPSFSCEVVEGGRGRGNVAAKGCGRVKLRMMEKGRGRGSEKVTCRSALVVVSATSVLLASRLLGGDLEMLITCQCRHRHADVAAAGWACFTRILMRIPLPNTTWWPSKIEPSHRSFLDFNS